MSKKLNVFLNSKIEPKKSLNSQFTLCKCYILALGKNRNLSHFSQEAVDDAMPSLSNIPVIGHLYEDEEGQLRMGSHDMVIELNEEGLPYFRSICVPYGVVPDSQEFKYEEVTEPDGSKVVYLTGDVILWTGRFPELKDVVYNDDVYFNQSMEIDVYNSVDLEEDNKYEDILKYEYSALCLLGKSDDPDFNYEPCFPMARVEKYAYSDDFNKLVQEMYEAIKESEKQSEEGGTDMENTVISVSETQTSETFEEVAAQDEPAVVESPAESSVEAPSFESAGADVCAEETTEPVAEEKDFSSTYNEKRKAIYNVLPNRVEEIGDSRRVTEYWLMDFDDEYAYVEENVWFNGDSESRYGRFPYTYDDSAKSATIAGDLVPMYVMYLTKEECDSIEADRAELSRLRENARVAEEAAHNNSIQEVLDDFDELLADNVDYAKIKDEAFSYKKAEDLREKCFEIYGRVQAQLARKPRTGYTVRVPIKDQDNIVKPIETVEDFNNYYKDK